MASKLSAPLTAADLANNDPVVEIDSAAIGMTDVLCHNGAYKLHNNVRDIVHAKGIKDFNIRDFTTAVETSLTKLFQDTSLHATGRQYAFTRAANSDLPQEPLRALPETVRAALPSQIEEGMKRLGLEVTVVPLRPPLSSMWDSGKTSDLH